MRALRPLVETVERLGVVDAALFALARLLALASADRCRLFRYRFVAQPVGEVPIAPPAPESRIAIRRVEPGDPLVSRFPRSPEVIAHRFRIGAQCVAAERQGQFVGFLWVKEAQYPEDEVRCTYVLDPRGAAVWDFDIHIEPQFRLGRTFARLWDGANGWLRARGYRWTISRISAFNPDSLAAHRRLGAVDLGRATFVRAGPVQLAFLGQAPFLHVGWRDEQAPTLRFRPPAGD